MAIPIFPASNGQIIQSQHVDLLASGAAWYSPDAGSAANTYIVRFDGTLNNSNSVAALSDGLMINFVAANPSNGASTLEVYGSGGTPLSVNGTTMIPLMKQGNTALTTGDIVAGQMIAVLFNADQSRFELVGSGSSGGGATDATGAASLMLYGDGSSGAVTYTLNTTLTSDVLATTLNVSAGVTINMAGYSIFCNGLATIGAGSVFINNGNNASGATAGLGAPGYSVPAGSRGSSSNGGPALPALANSGGVGGTGSYISYTTAASLTSRKILHTLTFAFANLTTSYAGGGGGIGGINQSSGPWGNGGGGGGGGTILLALYQITGSAFTMQAMGGNGGAAMTTNCGGGGGGGGGIAWLLTSTKAALLPSITQILTGGNGGAGGGGAGTAGSSGGIGISVIFHSA
jgi:hypothetical protein